MPAERRVLICANPDLNYIDGSAIWAQTIALILAETGLAKVDFLARRAPQRQELFGPLKRHPRISIISGPQTGKFKELRRNRLSYEEMAALAVDLDAEDRYDVILIRGLAIAQALVSSPEVLARAWIYLTNIPHSIESYTQTDRELVATIGRGCARILCQSDGFRDLWLALIPDLPPSKCVLYPPVIPDIQEGSAPISARKRVAIYAGKFAPEWMTLEMAESWHELRHADATLRMIGDKIHSDSTGFEPKMIAALRNTPGLEWLGAMSREDVQSQLLQARVGLSWRAESMSDTLEYSTKILEYGGARCAAILNRTPLHESLLGANYPLYANTREQYLRALEAALVDDGLAQAAADQLMKLAQAHVFSSHVRQVGVWLHERSPYRGNLSANTRTLTVLVAGHDLKFFAPLQRKLKATGKFKFILDEWRGHNSHDESRSRKLLAQADVIVCEWCLGNLVWYSNNRLPHQLLVARFHLQERELPYVADAAWDRVDHITYVSDWVRREGQRAFGFPEGKTSVIPNYLDSDAFFPKRKADDARYTLGLIGAAPARKRLDLAVDLLERLLEHDRRYRLRVKGRHPLDYEWLLKRPHEKAYYRQVFERINSHPLLSTRVIFDPPGDDVNNWLSMVGYVLSPSDFESFHMAIGEALLTGTRPIIWPWEGASETWGSEYVVDGLDAAVAVVRSTIISRHGLPKRMDPRDVVEAWSQLLRFGSTQRGEKSNAPGLS